MKKFRHLKISGAFGIIAFVILGFLLARVSSPTFLVVEPAVFKENSLEQKQTYAHNLNDRVIKFFGVLDLEFPRGVCTDAVKELYQQLAHKTTEITSGFRTFGVQRVGTINFGVESTETFGTIDLVKGNTLVGNNEEDSFISLHGESVIRLPKKERLTFLSMDFYGNSRGFLIINRGRFSTPALDCEFTSKNNVAICNCTTHKISGFTTD